MKIQLKRSSVLDGGTAKAPLDSQMEYGELALNYNSADPSIFIKDSTNGIVKLVGEGSITDAAAPVVPDTVAPPQNAATGNLWFNPTEGRLFIYYQDADSSQWVDASPDFYDPEALPNLSNSAVQTGTTDERYLMLNCANSPLTSDLQLNGNLTLDGLITGGGGINITGTSSLSATSISTTLSVAGSTALDSATVSSTLGVGGTTTLSTTSITGNLTVTGGGTNTLSNTSISGTLGVTGAATFANTAQVAGILTTAAINASASISANVAGDGSPSTVSLYSAQFSSPRTAGDAIAYYSLVDSTDGANGKGYAIYSAGTAASYFKGYVGINTSAPVCPFHIIQPATDNDFNWNAVLGSGADGDFRLVTMSGQTDNSANTIVARLGSVYQGNTYNAVINFVRGTSSNDGYFRFKPGQKPATVVDNNVEIRNNGNLAVLSMQGQGTVNVNVNNLGELTTSTSDFRLKDNIKTLGSATETVKQLRPVSFNWKDTEARGAKTELGFIAQEVKELVPEAVFQGYDEMYGLNADRLIPVLTKALQEALARIEALENA